MARSSHVPTFLPYLRDATARSLAVQALRVQGFSADSGSKQTAARLALAHALTVAEDYLEHRTPRAPERDGLRLVRRALEGVS